MVALAQIDLAADEVVSAAFKIKLTEKTFQDR
jgi:hypothetical protein